MASALDIARIAERTRNPHELVRSSSLHGRTREIDFLSSAFVRAGCGEGILLLVSGNSGAGKTSLVHAIHRNVLNENGFFLVGKFNQYQRDIPLFALRQAVQRLAAELASAPPAERRRWKELILQATGELGRLLTDLAPDLEHVIGTQPPVAEISPYEAPHRFAAVLRKFLGVFCQAEHPVVLFLDDCQWADSASLDVLRQLQIGTSLRYLLVIVSYRDNEVGAAHPLAGVLEELHRLETPIQKLELRNLSAAHLQPFLADALRPSVENLEALAEHFHTYTLGNPFFVETLLDFLHDSRDLWFDQYCQTWRWRRAALADHADAGDVVRLFVRKLAGLPVECRELLSLGACIGSCFDLETLSLVSNRSRSQCETQLRPALEQRVIRPWDGGSKESSARESRTGAWFAFQHDRVQQAAHSLVAPSDVPALRLRIGELLASQLPADQLEDRLLEVTDHLNAGRRLIQGTAEQMRLVEFNIAAGQKARVATAYKAALQFHRIAGEFLALPDLAEQFWQHHPDLALQYCKQRAETEFLEGERTTAEHCIREAVARARTPLDEADALCVLIVHYTLLASYPEAIDAGRRALAAVGIMLPDADFESARDAEIERVRQQLHGHSITALRQLPAMTDPTVLMVTRVLTTMGPPCYRSHPRLWSVLVAKIVSLTLQYGHVPQVGYSHPGFGGLLAWVANDYATAREFGALATQLMNEVFRTSSDHSVFYLMLGSSLRHWFEPLSAASRDYGQAWEAGLQSGNLQYAAYASGHNMYCRFYQGVPLAELIDESLQALAVSRARTNQWAIDLLEGGLRIFGTLADAPVVARAQLNPSEDGYLRQVLAQQNTQVACIYKVLNAFALFVLGHYEQALAWSDEAEVALDAVGTQGLLPWPEHVCTRLFLLTALYPTVQSEPGHAERQSAWRCAIDERLAQLQVWSDQCPTNYAHKWLLARAEVARIDGRETEALHLYEQSIERAREGNFTQWEAIAHERAAALSNACGHGRLSQIYWQNAHACYLRWGAFGKLRAMEAQLRRDLSAGPANAARGDARDEVDRPVEIPSVRLDDYLHALRTQVASAHDADKRQERLRLIEELTQATVNLREEVAERKRVQAELQQHRMQLAREIQERTAACERAERANEALQKSEERFRYVSSATNDAIWDWDLATNALWWSESFETLFGYRRVDLEQTITSWTDHIHPEDREKVISSIHQVIDGESSHWVAEYRYRRKGGTYAYVLDRGYILRDEAGQAIRMIGGMTDLSERKELEAQLLQIQKTEAIGQLAGGVAHDFNNLLTVINGYSEMLMSMVADNDSMRPLLADIRNAGERAANLTRQLLAFSRKQMLNPRVLDLNGVILNLERILHRLIGEDIEFVSVLDPNLWRVTVDPGQLEQVIVNLAVNARDAMPTGGRLIVETTNVEIRDEGLEARRGAKPGPYVALTVSDTGCGVPPEAKARLFEPFFTTKEVGKGTGLGLATVFGIVNQSDGLIEVQSEVGVGTEFKILLPAILEDVRTLGTEDSRVRHGNETILLVEDEEAVRRVTRRVLEAHGYQVLEAKNGLAAIDLIERHAAPIHLVITDVVMPEMGGRELTETLQRREHEAKVLFISGYTGDAVVQRGLRVAPDEFLQKPFTPLQLAKKVRDVLDHA